MSRTTSYFFHNLIHKVVVDGITRYILWDSGQFGQQVTRVNIGFCGQDCRLE